jgi:preprotein translocase subunit SecY
VDGQRHFLPFKINQAGVMPIVFGSALLMIPTTAGNGSRGGGPCRKASGDER